MERGYVAYSNAAKKDLLSVSIYTIQVDGVVSKQAAIEMAEGALVNSNAQISIAITGVSSDVDEIETGVVWIGCSGIGKGTVAYTKQYKGNRREFNEQVILDSLKILLDFVTT